MQTKFIVVAGGVISGVGKGIATASIGKIIKEYGYRVTLIKIDPYINCDAGTLRPTEHGEVWVTHDGGEIDQDLGTYERFIDEPIPKQNNITTGQVYRAVIERERRGEYLGKTVQFVPHITDEIRRRIVQAAEGYEVAIIEIGGTVGDYENVPFLNAVKSLELERGRQQVAHVLVTFLPVPDHIGEMKTKPTQQAVRMLNEQGISPDFLVCRSKYSLDDVRAKKISAFTHVPCDRILATPDVESVYQMPLAFERQETGIKLLKHLALEPKAEPNWSAWKEQIARVRKPKYHVQVAVVGKYLSSGQYCLTDSYLSICHALIHAGAQLDIGVEISWLDAEMFEGASCFSPELEKMSGLIVPGGFGAVGIGGKINAIRHAREQNLPYLGLCYGMQLAAVEYARNVCMLKGAHTTEVDPDTPHPIIDMIPLQQRLIDEGRYGGTMRLGGYNAVITSGTRVYDLYRRTGLLESCVEDGQEFAMVSERHRHRYEVNPNYVQSLSQAGLAFSGYHVRADGTRLMEFLELPNHPFFVGTQAHPEFTSRFGRPNPLFHAFVQACLEHELQECKPVPCVNNRGVSASL